ncbi:MAG TPA: hypothetical protein VM661_17535 [Candidatus Sulfotelmatobacter sp.]|jgi:hypothetical protein|nr:hypothetical protein [Candidatus Sulfotelmatobacter sp.]
MLVFGRLLQAAGLVIAAVGLANGVGILIATLRGSDAIGGYAAFALPVILAGLVPGGVLVWLGARLVGKSRD